MLCLVPLYIASIINTLHQSGAFLIIDQPTLIHYCHPKSILYIRIHSWCCTGMDFGKGTGIP